MSRSGYMKYAVTCVGLLLGGCFDDDAEDAKVSRADYLAVGNSLTAGYQNSGLRRDWQDSSYPALIARQMGLANFQIPFIDTPGLGSTPVAGGPGTPLIQDPKNPADIRAVALGRDPRTLLLNSGVPRPYDNLGIPGATTRDFLHATSALNSDVPGNAYFNIVLRNGILFQNSTMLSQVLERDPEILSLWIGNNDILFGVIQGTVVEGVTVTPAARYSSMMDTALDAILKETPAHVFLGNIPDINTIPFVTAVKPVVVDYTTGQIPLHPLTNQPIPLLFQEDSVQYVILPALSLIAQGHGVPQGVSNGLGDSLPATLTLSIAEARTATGLTAAYNAYLKKKADEETRITLVDANALLGELRDSTAAGKTLLGMTSTFVGFPPGNSAFSLDGIHPRTKAYKLVANLYIDAMNSALGMAIPKLEVK